MPNNEAGAGGFGGFGRSSTSSTSAGTTARQYPNNTTIGDAYFSIDPETRRVVYIADAATAQAIAQVLTNLDRPKPQVLIKVVFLEVTHNNASDIGLEGGYGKQNMNGTVNNGERRQRLRPVRASTAVGTNLNQFGQPISSFSAASPDDAAGRRPVPDPRPGLPGDSAGHCPGRQAPRCCRARPSSPATTSRPPSPSARRCRLITSVRYDTFGNAINSVTYTDVGVILEASRPLSPPDGLVEMIISPQISSIDPTLTVPISANVSAPVIDIRSADTVAVTADGQTVIIGGLLRRHQVQDRNQNPLLGDIPLLGNLFKRRQDSDAKT